MIHYQSLSLKDPGPSFSDKGKAKEMLQYHQPPSWFPSEVEEEDSKLEGAWYGHLAKDEAYVSGLPVVPAMVSSSIGSRPRSMRSRKRRKITPMSDANHGTCFTDSSATLVDEPLSMTTLPKTDPLSNTILHPKPINLTTKIHKNVDTLFNIRKTVHQIQDWQKAENEGLPLPITRPHIEKEERRRTLEQSRERKRRRKEERIEAKKRMRVGGEVGEEEAALEARGATASMLAQAGFEGMSFGVNLCMVVERLSNLGKTFRLLIDGFSHKMSSEVCRTPTTVT
jgi:transcriptional activator SPT7